MVFRQVLATLTANLMTLSFGLSVGWSAPNMIFFQSDNSPVGKLTMAEISPIASLLAIGGATGTIFFGYFTSKMGRKFLLLLSAVPQAVALILIIVGDHPNYIYASRIMTGFSAAGSFAVVPIFVGEISDPKIRGSLGAIFMLSSNSGVMIGFLLSSYLDYSLATYLNLGTVTVYFIVFMLFPETPEYLLLKGFREAAEDSYKFYNGVSKTKSLPTKLQLSYDNLKDFVLKQNENVQKNQSIFKEFRDKAALLGFIYCLIPLLGSNLSGAFVITNYLTYLFEQASIELDIYLCTIIVGAVQIIGSALGLILVDKLGRRFLYITSASFSGLLMAVCGIYYYLIELPSLSEVMIKLQWVPLVAICGFVIICNAGINCLPFFMIPELVSVHLRGTVATISLVLAWTLIFILLQFFPVVITLIGIYGALGFFACCCFLEVVFIYFCLPETKGITFQEIQTKLYKNRI